MTAQSLRSLVVGTTRVRLDDTAIGVTSNLTYQNLDSTVDLWVGDDTVTVGGGIKIPAGQSGYDDHFPPSAKRYGIASSDITVCVDQVASR